MNVANIKTSKQLVLTGLIVVFLAFLMMLLSGNPNQKLHTVTLSLIPLDEKKDTVVVFMGYIGCADVCPPALAFISKYGRPALEKTPVYWINLTEGFDASVVKQFASEFGMKGIQPSSFAQVQQFAREIGDKVYRAPISPDDVVHSGYFYRLVRKDSKWIADDVLRTNSPTIEQFHNFTKSQI